MVDMKLEILIKNSTNVSNYVFSYFCFSQSSKRNIVFSNMYIKFI